MKLIIDIPEDVYKRTVFYREFKDLNDCVKTIKALENGTPLDDVKAEMEKQIERDFAYAETEVFKVPCHLGTANGLQVAVRILDNIGKESEDKE